MRPAPVALFAFNRPAHFRRTLEALAANELANASPLVIFCDGPRHAEEKALTDAVRELARAAQGFASVTVCCRENNVGLAENITSGITELLSTDDCVIVLEDDLLTSPYFLRYMNEALALYENEDQVGAIHAYTFPHNLVSPPETFFLRIFGCWGWGTWKRAWNAFNPNGQQLLQALDDKKLLYAFDADGAYPYADMLRDQVQGKNNSWAVRWYASNFLLERLMLYPCHSLVKNMGMDATGIHCKGSNIYDVSFSERPIVVCSPFCPIEVDSEMTEAFKFFFRRTQKQSLLSSFIRNGVRLMKRVCPFSYKHENTNKT